MQKALVALILIFHGVTGAADEHANKLQKVIMPYLNPKDPPAVILYTFPGMAPMPPPPPPGQPAPPVDSDFHRVHVAAWSDGRIVWSHDMQRGGSPYYTAKIDRSKVLEVYRVLEEETAGADQETTSSSIIDGAAQHIVVLNSDGRTGIEWISSHPNFEKNPKLIYTSRGVSSVEHYKPEEVPSAEELAFQRFRKDFDRLKAAILKLTPTQKFRFRFSWTEVNDARQPDTATTASQ